MSGNIAELKLNRCIVLSACPVTPEMVRYLQPGDFVIACDAGYRNLAILNVKANLILGDFDSAPQPDEKDLIVLPHVKDDTDTQYAAAWAAEHSAKEVVILGGLGGTRMEHTIANLSTGLFLTKRGVKCILADEHSELHYLSPNRELVLEHRHWEYFSVFPMEGALEGLDVSGAFYPLKGAKLTAEYPLGVSNEFVENTVSLHCTAGYGLVILTKEK